ncbi:MULTISPECIES: LysE family translocator [unclassified Rathayibacter]|uniref:LysE family translocator n=1 Tax=unclassified Rathayibacter TaxID=2609250 RepID=UPI002263DD9A|nr:MULTISPECIES: LysE family translocator [unclassified Rathayibacter]
MAYMIAVGLQGGRRAAVKAILGIGTGMGVYAAAVVVGVGELIRSFPVVLVVLKLLGAGYLLWLAFSTVRSTRRADEDENRALPAGRWYMRGVTISLTNPKVMLFFLAVLPQFLGNATNPTAQLALLGAVNVVAEVLLYGAVGLMAGSLHARFTGSQRATSVLHYLAAGVYLVLAAVVILETVISLNA